MQTEEAFAILEIGRTKDEKAIKDAYRQKLTHTNPEDDPEGFKKLRAAYEEACSYAEGEEETVQVKEDNTPSGLWVKEAEKLYGRLSTRCDVQLWQELFDRDIFVSLEGSEECRRKLMIFMMNHFNYPDSVWTLIQHNLQIREDSIRLKEQFPQDYIDFLVRRCMTKEIIDYTMFEGPDDADYDTYIHCYNVSWDCLNQKDYDKLRELLGQADATGITHPYMELVRAALYRDTGEAVRAQDMVESLYEKYPADTTVIFQLAELYHETKQEDKAIACYQKLKNQDNNHYMANYRLAGLYVEQEEYEAARECIRMVMRRGHDDAMQELRTKVNHKLESDYQVKWEQERDVNAAKELAWCLLQDDRFLAADTLTKEMASVVPEDMISEYLGLCARIYMGQSQFQRTLEAADRWLTTLNQMPIPKDKTALAEYNRDVEIAHRIKMSVYHMMGRGFSKYYANAMEEFEFYKQQETMDPNALIDKARIYLEKEEYQKCLDTAEELLSCYQVQYAYVLMQEAYVKLWDAGNVIRCGMQCIHLFPNYERPYEEIARVYYELKQPDKLKEILDLARENKVESAYLEAYACQEGEKPEDYPIGKYLDEFKSSYAKRLAESGNMKYYEDGYPIITKYLNLFPCNYILNTRGLFSMAGKKYEAALKDFHKILERDPADQFALNNIGCVLKYTGHYEEALPYFERAWYYMYREGKEEPNAMPLGNMAHTYELMGEYALAARTYQRLIDEISGQKDSLVSMKDISANLARSGQVDEALKVLDTYMRTRQEYQTLKYRVYLYGADWDNVDKMQEAYGKQISYFSSTPGQLAFQIENHHIHAWKMIRTGQYDKALNNMNQALGMLQRVNISVKKKTDLYSNKLFVLWIMSTAQGMATVQHKAIPDEKTKPSLFDKITELLKPKKTNQETEAVQAVKRFNDDARSCAQQLQSMLKRLCKMTDENGNYDAMKTSDFFYKERYVRYLEFLIALFTGSSEDVEKAIEVMEKSERCRLCNHGECMRSAIAKAMYAAYQGDIQQAGIIFRKLLASQPYNLYALCGADMIEKRRK